MFFIDLNDKRIKTFECSLEKLQNDSPVIHFLFKHNLCILSMMTTLLLKDSPRQVSNKLTISNKKSQLTILTRFGIQIRKMYTEENIRMKVT